MFVRGLIVCALVGCGRYEFDATASDAAAFRVPHCWSFEDDPSDGVSADPAALDVVATCTPGSCPQHVVGKHGMGLGFEGAQFARIPHRPELDLPDAFTVSMWVTNSDPSVDRVVAAKPLGAADRDSWLFIHWATNNTCYETTISNGALENVCRTDPMAIDTWYHLAGTWDGETKRLYINGELAGEMVGTPPVFGTNDIMLGGDANAGALAYPWHGRLDELCVFDHALTGADIAALAE